jgi:hypothetical protein
MAAQSKALKNYKEQCVRRAANLLDPTWGVSHAGRAFPQFYIGMSTDEYIRRFENLSPMKHADGWVYADRHTSRPSPMLNPDEPEVVLLLDDEVAE